MAYNVKKCLQSWAQRRMPDVSGGCAGCMAPASREVDEGKASRHWPRHRTHNPAHVTSARNSLCAW